MTFEPSRLLRDAFTQAPLGLAVLDLDLRYLAINDTLARINRRDAAEHLGRTVHEVLPGLAPTLEPLLRRALAGEVVGYSWEQPGDRGLMAAARAVLQPIRSADGAVEGLVVVVEDVTVEARLRHRNEQLRDLSNNLAALTSWLDIPALVGTVLRADSGVSTVGVSIPDDETHRLITATVLRLDHGDWAAVHETSDDMDGEAPVALAFRGTRSAGPVDWPVTDAAPVSVGHQRTVPLAVTGRYVGALTVAWPQGEQPAPDQLEFVELVALRTAVAVERLVSSSREERAAQRAAALLQAASHLNTVLDPVGVAAEIVRCVSEETGATGVGIFLLDDDHQSLRRVHAEPFDDPHRYSRFDEVRLDDPLPVTRAVRDARSIWLEHRDDWSPFAPVVATAQQLGWPAVAAVPLTSGPETAVSGSLYAHFQPPRRITPEDRQFLTTLAALAAATFDRIRSETGREQVGRRLADRELRLAKFAESRACGILEVNDTHITAANRAFLDMLGYERLPEGGLDWREITPPGWEHVDVAGLAALHEQGVAPPFAKEYYRADGTIVPVLISVAAVHEDPFEGVATVVDLSEQRQAERRQVAEMAARERLTAAVQTALFPQLAVAGDRYDVRVAYRAGDERLALGGDFYDACTDSDGRLGVVIGDVTGHGPDAAACGAALRAAWRALTITGMPLHEMHASLDAVLLSERPPEENGLALATLLCAQIAPDGCTRMLVAGHPEPILWSPGTAAPLTVRRAALLGLGQQSPPPLTETRLAPGQTLLLFTDGLVEGRVEPGALARLDIAGLCDILRRTDLGEPLESILEAVTERNGGPLRDDAALVAVRLADDDRAGG